MAEGPASPGGSQPLDIIGTGEHCAAERLDEASEPGLHADKLCRSRADHDLAGCRTYGVATTLYPAA